MVFLKHATSFQVIQATLEPFQWNDAGGLFMALCSAALIYIIVSIAVKHYLQ